MKSGGSLSIWFFIGLSLAVNGAVIFARGIYELMYPPPEQLQVVLATLHANIWWGATLLILGLFFSLRYSPARERTREHDAFDLVVLTGPREMRFGLEPFFKII